MPDYHSRRTRRKSATGLPASQDLFEWASAQLERDMPPRPLSRVAQTIARRHRLSPHIARTIAELAGFNLEAAE